MPLYEYQCQKCGHEFEALVLPRRPAARCPQCTSKSLKQLLSQFAVSSESTRKSNLKSARKRARAIKKEKDVEQAKYEERERKEHYGG